MSEKENERVPASILGKEIGTMTGWDQGDSFAIQFYDFEVNDLGKRFFRGDENFQFSPGATLWIDFDSGKVSYYDHKERESELIVDWGVFNNG